MTDYPTITPQERPKLFNHFLDLIQICDSFDQLGLLASILDTIYSPQSVEHFSFFLELQDTARHLKGLPMIGRQEVGRD